MPAIILDPNSYIPHPSNAPALTTEAATPAYKYLAFDDGTDELAYWVFWMDNFYDSGTITIDIFWKAAATSGDVVWKVFLQGKAEGEEWDTALATTESLTDTVQGTTEYLGKGTLTFSTPGISPSDLCVLKIHRDADDGADDMSGDAKLLYIVVKYNVAG